MFRPDHVARGAVAVVVLACAVLTGSPPASAFPAAGLPGQLMFGGLPRTYQVHVPAGLPEPAGLVLNLHGAGQTGAIQADLTNYNAVADAHGFVVAYPDGIDMAWADGRGASIPDREGVDDVGFLVALADRLADEHGVDPGRVYATGISAGGFMASRLACERADVFAAVAPIAGSLAAGLPCEPTKPVSVFQVHGTADPVVPFNGGRMLGRGGHSDVVPPPEMAQRWRELNDCPAPPAEEVRGQVRLYTSVGCADGTEVVFVAVEGGGHTWLDATAASAQFFATHARPDEERVTYRRGDDQRVFPPLRYVTALD